MIEVVKHVIVIFTNHNVNISIIKQTTLFSSNIDKLNFRLIRAFIYLFQFQLKIKYRSDKNHIVSNVLFRLFFDNNQIDSVNVNSKNKLNLNIYYVNMLNPFCSKQIEQEIYVMNKILIEMSNNFRKRILDDYAKKKVEKNFLSCFSLCASVSKKK